ncbi:MAG: hypothetical protein NVSMB55_05400 [Mycobacteriales bacterium]
MDEVTRSRLIVLPVLALLATPLLTMQSDATTTSAAPVFRQYHGPASPLDARGMPQGADSAGEPSLGFDPKTGDVLFMANKNTYRVHNFDPRADNRATWDDVTDPVEGAQTSDPILWRDPTTNRTFINQLELQGGSLQAYTDNNGKTYTHSTMGGSIGIAFDHQSVVTGKPPLGGSPYPKPLNYPNYVYYCTNDIVDASCAVSVDGGLNFLVATPVYTSGNSNCRRIFGHLKTDPRTGRLFLPPDGCGGKQAIYYSDDAATTWTRSDVPGSTNGDSGHPSLAVAKDGTVYFAYGSADQGNKTGRTHVVVSTTGGKTWAHDTALGADLGIVTSRFPVDVAGDGDRAAVAFLGSKTAGDPNAAPDPTTPSVKAFAGTWDLYVSFTTDRGVTWKTYDAAPTDPVQRGPVCTKGTTCLAGRNLLDFNDMVLDDKGHVAIAMADGSPTGKEDYTKALAKATVVRQVSGPSLFAAAVRAPAPVTAGRQHQPPAMPPGSGGSGNQSLPRTGLPATLPAVGLVLLIGAAVAVRRRVAG